MNRRETEILPVGVALFTRGGGESDFDYGWMHEAGESRLLPEARALNEDYFAKFDARPAISLALFAERDRVGLLAANLRSPRRDHMKTTIEDTLLIEAGMDQYEALARLAADLIGDDESENRRRLLDYAEAFFRDRPSAVGPLMVVEPEYVEDEVVTFGSDRVAFRSTPENRRRIASALYRSHKWQSPMLVVSTGLVSKETLQKLDPKWRTLFALSKSSSLPEEGEVQLTLALQKVESVGNKLATGKMITRVVALFGGAVIFWEIAKPRNDKPPEQAGAMAVASGIGMAAGTMGLWPAIGMLLGGKGEPER